MKKENIHINPPAAYTHSTCTPTAACATTTAHAARRSQPKGSTAHKSTSSPIHLSVIVSAGNTDTIIQWLQGMVCAAWYFS